MNTQEGYIDSSRHILFKLRKLSRVTSILIMHIVDLMIFLEFAGDHVLGTNNNNISNTSERSSSTESKPDVGNTSNQMTHRDLTTSCSTLRDILSEDVAYSCDYSMLYYKGQCERYSDLPVQNKSDTTLLAENDLSFCSDPRVERYIEEHGLTHAPKVS